MTSTTVNTFIHYTSLSCARVIHVPSAFHYVCGTYTYMQYSSCTQHREQAYTDEVCIRSRLHHLYTEIQSHTPVIQYKLVYYRCKDINVSGRLEQDNVNRNLNDNRYNTPQQYIQVYNTSLLVYKV